MHTLMHTYAYANSRSHIHTHTQIARTQGNKHTNMYTQTITNKHIHSKNKYEICTRKHANKQVHMHTNNQTQTSTYKQTSTNARTNKRTKTHAQTTSADSPLGAHKTDYLFD